MQNLPVEKIDPLRSTYIALQMHRKCSVYSSLLLEQVAFLPKR